MLNKDVIVLRNELSKFFRIMILIKFLDMVKVCALIKLISGLTFKFDFIKILMKLKDKIYNPKVLKKLI